MKYIAKNKEYTGLKASGLTEITIVKIRGMELYKLTSKKKDGSNYKQIIKPSKYIEIKKQSKKAYKKELENVNNK